MPYPAAQTWKAFWASFAKVRRDRRPDGGPRSASSVSVPPEREKTQELMRSSYPLGVKCLGAGFRIGPLSFRERSEHGASAVTPSGARRRPGQRRSAGAKSMHAGRLTYGKSYRCGRDVPAPAAGIVQDRPEPVKPVCDRRTTAPVELPGKREDDLDRTCPAREMAATGNKDTSGQGL